MPEGDWRADPAAEAGQTASAPGSAPLPLDGQRRVITAILADVKGSTDLAERVDVEAWVEIMNRVFQILGAEIYRYGGEVDQYRGDGLVEIEAAILVERESQKAIVIGRGGHLLKQVGVEAREDLERLLDARVFLRLWVKVRPGWRDNERALRELGLD